jgi:hypothetical protein
MSPKYLKMCNVTSYYYEQSNPRFLCHRCCSQDSALPTPSLALWVLCSNKDAYRFIHVKWRNLGQMDYIGVSGHYLGGNLLVEKHMTYLNLSDKQRKGKKHLRKIGFFVTCFVCKDFNPVLMKHCCLHSAHLVFLLSFSAGYDIHLWGD